MNTQQRTQLAALCRTIRWDVDMASHSTFRTGGVVEAMVETGAPDELAVLMRWLHRQKVPWRVIGGGSNILVTSRYHEGVYIRLQGSVDDLTAEPWDATGTGDDRRVLVGAGCNLAALVAWCTRKGLTGLEFMAGIPGTVGGAIRMNAGAFGHSISDALQAVRWTNDQGEVLEAEKQEIVFSYRSTRLPGEPLTKMLITHGVFQLQSADKKLLAARCREIIEQRRQKQPSGFGSAGSFFKNPDGDFAGRLIERAGLKGLTFGKAMVSPQHANFIVNTGGAVPEDIIGLMQEVRRKVQQQSGVLLEPEVHIF
jgi:UDP-N-acetylmuramate dehydrogenase